MAAKAISKSEFKARALEILRAVESSGQPVLITDHGKPTIEVRQYCASNNSPLAILQGSVTRFDRPHDPVGEDDWELAS